MNQIALLLIGFFAGVLSAGYVVAAIHKLKAELATAAARLSAIETELHDRIDDIETELGAAIDKLKAKL